MGKRRIEQSLGTRDLTEARRRRNIRRGELERLFEAAGRDGKAASDDIMQHAWELRTRAEHGGDADTEIVTDADGNKEFVQVGLSVSEEAELIAERVEKTHGEAAARAFYRTATSTDIPLDRHIEAWLAESNYPTKGRLQHRGTVAELVRWCATAGVTPDLKAITKKCAGAWVVKVLADGQTKDTVIRKLSTLRQYWRWLTTRDYAEVNPWVEIKLPKSKRPDPDSTIRGYTDGEMLKLLTGGATPVLLDFIKIAALTGSRLERIAQLTVADCQDRCFFIKRDKTAAGTRRVPIHSALQPIIDARCQGGSGPEWLFPTLSTRASTDTRSSGISNAFARYRLRLGVHEAKAVGRGSRVNYHAFRHWFQTKAFRAGHPDAVVAQVVRA